MSVDAGRAERERGKGGRGAEGVSDSVRRIRALGWVTGVARSGGIPELVGWRHRRRTRATGMYPVK